VEDSVAKRKQKRPLEPRQGAPSSPGQPESNEQSGSTGRHTGARELDPTKDSGQDEYGQSGYGGATKRETIGQADYRKSGSGAGQKRISGSNPGSGRAGDETLTKQKPR
jgi:hypothetical protein